MKPETSQQPFIFKPSAMPGGSGGRSATLESTAGRVHETQAEISEIVREVAQASATRLREAEYWSFLSDRVLRAMAAYGVVIWKQIRPGEFQVLSRLGETTDRALPDEAKPAHARLLREIADHHQPAVVPPTPGATDPDVPANPSSVPVALVAFGVSSADEDEPADYLIEVFLEPGGGVATQRGYLRFVAQMADLAGEFVRSQLLIRYRRDEIRTRQVDEASARFQQLQSPLSVAEAIVDEAAEAFSLDRVALVEADKTATVVAVSHVERIDSESPAVHWIEKLVGEHNEESPREAFWADVSIPRGMTDDAASQDRALEESPRHNGARSSGASGLAKTGESRLRCECIVPLFDDRSADGQTVQGTFLVGLVDESSSGPPFEDRIHFGRFAMFGGQALVHAQQRALPGTRWWSSLSGTTLAESRGRGKIRRLMAMFVLIALIATFVPVPLMVTSDATFHCEDIQAVCSPRNAVVEAVHVEHDQFVRAGDPLVTLRDDDLQQELTRLEGERLRLET
ncbi:MAG: biotin/lipoyl-binding protein, partial [Planctomycetota bacterium]